MAESMLDMMENFFNDCNIYVIDEDMWHGQLVWELEAYTDAGGDMIHHLYVPLGKVDDISAWRKAFFDMMNDFDPWEETFKWCDETGKPRNTPFDNGIDLYNDHDKYKHDVLEKAYDKLMDFNG